MTNVPFILIAGSALMASVANQAEGVGRAFPRPVTVSNNYAEMHTTFSVLGGPLKVGVSKGAVEGNFWDLTALGNFSCMTAPPVPVGNVGARGEQRWEMPVTIFAGGYPPIKTPWGDLTMLLYSGGEKSGGAIVSAGSKPEFPATSYMDFYMLVTVGGVALITEKPARVEVTEPTINAWPPEGAAYKLTNGPVRLYLLGDKNKTPVAQLEGTTITIRYPVRDSSPSVIIRKPGQVMDESGKGMTITFDVTNTLPAVRNLGYSVVDEQGWITADRGAKLFGEIRRFRADGRFEIPVRVTFPQKEGPEANKITLQVFPLSGTRATVTRRSIEVRRR